jgi:ABC-2 type transport system permease protein
MVHSPSSRRPTTSRCSACSWSRPSSARRDTRTSSTGPWALLFSSNVSRRTYVIGRFLGAYAVSFVLYLAINAGQLFGALLTQGLQLAGLIDTAVLGPHRLDVYLWPYVVGAGPMLFFTGVVFFSLALLTRAMAPVYVGVTILVLGYTVLGGLLDDVGQQPWAALLDPFGNLAFDLATRYWTPAEQNRDLLPLSGVLLANRALWTGLGGALLAFTALRFRPTVDEQRRSRATRDEAAPGLVAPPAVTLTTTTAGWLRVSASTALLLCRAALRSPIYWSFITAGLGFLVFALTSTRAMFGTATLPVTWQVLELSGGAFRLFVFITITFYAGELVWNDRDAHLADIVDAARVPSWVLFAARVGALWLIAGSLQLVVGLAALVAQWVQGPIAPEWRLYVIQLLPFGLLRDVTLCALALFVQVLLNHKYLAHGVMVLNFVSMAVLGMLGVEERLLRFGAEPRIDYSDLNGFGHWVPAVLWYRSFWYLVMAVLLAVASVFVVRGRETTWPRRLAAARARMTRGWIRATAALGLLVLAVGALLLVETHLKRPYVTEKDEERLQADYEKTYRAEWLDVPQPRIIDADMRFELFPEEAQPRLIARGTYLVENNTSTAMDRVMVALPHDVIVHAMGLGAVPAGEAEHDARHGVWRFALRPPLSPGERRPLTFNLEFISDPLVHGGGRSEVVENGTFFNNDLLPVIGYQPNVELDEVGDRKTHGLPPKDRMATRDDPRELQHNFLRRDSDLIGFRATVCTAPDQLAIAPGSLTREWTENGRRCFRYEMDQPIPNFFSVLSARYEVRRDEWNGNKLELYFHPTHDANLDRMMQGMKDALAWCSEAFGPYPHRQARILEFPRYQAFAQSFPNTIPYSEAIGFIARVRDGHPDDLDYPYYVTAHEIAHQWWGHQVIGANVRGASMTSETMAQYSALMVMKRRFGPLKMRRFLKYELDRYLQGRAVERIKELPLAQNESQPYIHYNKGSLAMYALQDYLGEDTVNRALRKYVEAVRYRGPPYTTSKELLDFLRAETPAEYEYLIVARRSR